MLPYFNQAICKSLRFVETPTWRVPSPSSYFTAYQTEIMLYSSFWRVGVNTNRSAAQPPPPPFKQSRQQQQQRRRDVVGKRTATKPGADTQLTAFIFLLPCCFQPSRRYQNDSTDQSAKSCWFRKARRGERKQPPQDMDAHGGREVNMRACEWKRKKK